ncbi:hypothetical protein LV78_008002 [Actinosynnema pretiosum]|nr:hypothetical protein [Actinosynnema pretiosum]
MLQIITGMYFRDVPLNQTEHRRTLYTNVVFSEQVQVELPMGYLTPDGDRAAINTVLVHLTERLEAVLPDGSDEFMISTGGDAIADDLAVVLSFALNATFTPVREKADRLIHAAAGAPIVLSRRISSCAPSLRRWSLTMVTAMICPRS